MSEGLPSKVLVVGVDSAIGEALACSLRQANLEVLGTSRRPSSSWLPLDLGTRIDTSALPEAQTVFLCAAISGFAACEADPLLAARVNVEATVALGRHYMERGAHVVFLSSTAVFGSRGDAPNESCAAAPDTAYGVFKRAGELALQAVARSTAGRCAIVRLTKVLSAQTPVLNQWRSANKITAFSDTHLCPIALPYVVDSLICVARRRADGIFHLAGEQTLSYAALAHALTRCCWLNLCEITEIRQGSPGNSGVQPQCVALTMSATTQQLGIRAQSLEDCLLGL